MFTFLDLFAGLGGFSLGLERAGMTCKGQVEKNDYCTRKLAKRWPHVWRGGNIETIQITDYPTVNLVAAGYPCQPESWAGKREGKRDHRWLWPFVPPVLKRTGASWFIGENVAGHIGMGLDTVLSDLEAIGYTARAFVVPACALDAEHRRDRVWVIAHSNGIGCKGNLNQKLPPQTQQRGDPVRVAFSSAHGRGMPERYNLPASRICRGADAVPGGLERIEALGNAVYLPLVEFFGRLILSVSREVQ